MSACISKSGRVRERHDFDRDGVCYFCDEVDRVAAAADLPPHSIERREVQEFNRKAAGKADLRFQRPTLSDSEE